MTYIIMYTYQIFILLLAIYYGLERYIFNKHSVKRIILWIIIIIFLLSGCYYVEFKEIDYSVNQLYEKAVMVQNTIGRKTNLYSRDIKNRISLIYLNKAHTLDENNIDVNNLIKKIKREQSY